MAEPIELDALAEEVGDAAFEDERLNKRLKTIVAALGAAPGMSLPRSFDDAGLEAAYRFFSNVHVTPEEILAPHVEATRERCDSHQDFLVIHDSTAFAYRRDGERRGLGRFKSAGPGAKQAFFAHVSLAVSADGTRRPLGVAGLTTWIRGESKSGTEYQRWEKQLRQTAGALNGQRSAIHVMDREADDYEMFDALIRDGHRFVVRCMHNRCLESESGKLKIRALFDTVSATVTRGVWLTRRRAKLDPIISKIHPPREERGATLSVSAATVVLKRPQSRREHTTNPPPSVTINVVRVWEPDPPEGDTPVEWLLFTNDPIETPEQQLAIVDHYRARWMIEEYFKALKTGCDFERRQLQDYESLINLLATFAPIAYHLLLIRTEARKAPDADAAVVLSRDHLDVLRLKGRRKLGPTPTVRDVYLAVAALGGHLKRNGDPGWLTLARGYEKLETLTEGWLAAKLHLRSDQ